MTRFWVFYSRAWSVVERLVGQEHRWCVRYRQLQTYLRNQGFGHGDRVILVASDVKSVVGTAIVDSEGFTGQTFRLGAEQYQEFKLAEIDLWTKNRWKPVSVLRNYGADLGPLYMRTARFISERAFNGIIKGSTVPETTSRSPTHQELVNMITEMGRWERFDARAEETIETSRFDVTWRLAPHGEPRRVYEVELSQNISAALTRLKDASDRWNSELFLVTTPGGATRARTLLDGPFLAIRSLCKIILLSDIVERYEAGRIYFKES